MNERLYKVMITDYPAVTYEWEPEGWAENPDSRDRDGNFREFSWPAAGKVYKSRSSATDRAALIESYGATAVVMETTTDWLPIEDANKLRKRRRDAVRIAKLQAKIAEIEATS